jgi:uncharacterized membrane protein (UPF0127 family)
MKVIIQDNIFKVKLCTTPKSIIDGMSKKMFDDSFNGMLFLFPEIKNQKFWMYNCIIPLDIIMINDNVITKIHHNCPPCIDENECLSYCGEGDKVLEVLGGTCKSLNIKKGDIVTLQSY